MVANNHPLAGGGESKCVVLVGVLVGCCKSYKGAESEPTGFLLLPKFLRPMAIT